MQGLLHYNPEKRLTATQALTHPFFSDLCLNKALDEFAPESKEPISQFEFEFEQFQVCEEILRDLLIDEIIQANSLEAQSFVSEF